MRKRGQAHALLQAHARFGAATPAQLRGAFGIALMDAERNEVLLATDHFGRVPLYYAPLAKGIGFAPAPALLRAHAAAATDLGPQALFNYAYAHVVFSLLATYACAQFAAAEGCTHRLARWGPRLPGKLASYIAQARVSLSDRLQAKNFIHALDARTMFTPQLLAEVEADIEQFLQLQRAHYERVQGAPLNRMLDRDWQWTLADNDLRKVCTARHAADVTVDYPVLDERTVDLACRCRLPPRHARVPTARGARQTQARLRPALRRVAARRPPDSRPWPTTTCSRCARNRLQPGFIDSAIELHRHGHAITTASWCGCS